MLSCPVAEETLFLTLFATHQLAAAERFGLKSVDKFRCHDIIAVVAPGQIKVFGCLVGPVLDAHRKELEDERCLTKLEVTNWLSLLDVSSVVASCIPLCTLGGGHHSLCGLLFQAARFALRVVGERHK